MSRPKHSRESYTVGIICALFIEKAAADAVLDEEHAILDKSPGDDNTYTFGRIGVHNVVLACLPAGVTGKSSAAAVAKDMSRSFPIKIGLMVGIGGGVWSKRRDIRLGDVIVSTPDGDHGGVVQWDFGKMESGGIFRRTGTLNKPPMPLLSAVQELRARHESANSDIERYHEEMLKNKPRMARHYGHQGSDNDELFEACYSHIGGDSCDHCDQSRLVVRRPERSDLRPVIHYGNIASGDEIVKDGVVRDRIAKEQGILCFEMEAAGLMDRFPCVVIRGVCDYADSHKNKEWQRYAAATAACYAKELLTVVDKQAVSRLEDAAGDRFRIHAPPRLLPTADYYVARETERTRLEEFFDCGAVRAQEAAQLQRKVFTVYGLGGIGKTQLCADFARKHQQSFSAILWLDGSSKDALKQSFTDIASSLPNRAAQRTTDPVETTIDVNQETDYILQWLSLPGNNRWLMIIDNVDRAWSSTSTDSQAYDYRSFLPQADQGNVLITTRLALLGSHQAEIHLEGVDDDIGKRIVEAQLRGEVADIEKLLDSLKGLPLALVQAGAYMRQTRMRVPEYLQYYEETWNNLMFRQNRQFPLQEYAERSVLTTWKMSYDQVLHVDTSAARLLDLASFLHSEDVWYELISVSTDHELIYEADVPFARDIPKTKLAFRDAVATLSSYSLIISKDTGFAIHPVVHSWCYYNLEDEDQRTQLLQEAVSMVASNIPSDDDKARMATVRRLLPHARSVADRSRKLFGSTMVVSQCHDIAVMLQDWESSVRVEQLYLRALEGKEKVLGPDHASTLGTMNNLGALYQNQGKMAKAEAMYLRALAGKEKAWGPNHTSTLNTLNNLGAFYQNQGKMAKAEAMYLRALEGKEKVWGPNHTSTLPVVNNLGILYKNQGKMAEAEKMYLRALEGYEKAWGPNHTSTLDTVNNLSVLYADKGETIQAEAMYKRAIEGYEKVWGPDHTSTLRAVSNLGMLYATQNKIGEAEAMYLRALKGFEKAWGPDHTSTLDAVNNLRLLYRS